MLVYNLEVYKKHIYYVGINNLLVHNVCSVEEEKRLQVANIQKRREFEGKALKKLEQAEDYDNPAYLAYSKSDAIKADHSRINNFISKPSKILLKKIAADYPDFAMKAIKEQFRNASMLTNHTFTTHYEFYDFSERLNKMFFKEIIIKPLNLSPEFSKLSDYVRDPNGSGFYSDFYTRFPDS